MRKVGSRYAFRCSGLAAQQAESEVGTRSATERDVVVVVAPRGAEGTPDVAGSNDSDVDVRLLYSGLRVAEYFCLPDDLGWRL